MTEVSALFFKLFYMLKMLLQLPLIGRINMFKWLSFSLQSLKNIVSHISDTIKICFGSIELHINLS